jgi:7-carboxy-7-deazaguanine synthase
MLRVNEIFHSIQGESTLAGCPCVFVRLTGCNLRCTWCDTAYAFHEGSPMSVDEVVQAVRRYECPLVELTGGEPLLQPDAIPLMRALQRNGHRVMLETGGSLPIDEVPEGVLRIVDVKCPGSREAERNRWENLSLLRPDDEVKFVLADRDDYLWAVSKVKEHELLARCVVLFSSVHSALAPGELGRWVLQDRLAVRVQVQMHKILWPGVERGV